MADNLDEIRTGIKNDKVVIGTERVMKGIRSKTVSKVFLSNNVPSDIKEDIEHFAGIEGIPVDELSITNEELGVVCKKKFQISVLATL